MNLTRHVKLGGLAVLALAVTFALFGALGQGHLTSQTTLAGGVGEMAVDCDASQGGIQSDCTYAPGSTFNVEIDITDPPAGGYFFFQEKLRWTEGVVDFVAGPPGDAALWGPCTIPAQTDNRPLDPSVLFACVPLPALTTGSTDTGAVLSFEFQCLADPQNSSPPAGLDPNQSLLTQVPRVGDAQGGTHFGDANVSEIDPVLTDATVTCAEPTPTDTPVPGAPTDTPVPGAPTDTPVPGEPTAIPGVVLVEDAAVGAETIKVSDASGFVVGDIIVINLEGANGELAVIVAIAGNTLTLSGPNILAHEAGEPVELFLRLETISELAEPASSGDTQIVVEDASGFAPGDIIVLNLFGLNGELAVVNSVDEGTGTLSLRDPLELDHQAGELVMSFGAIFTELEEPASAGDTTIIVVDSTGFAVGDTILIGNESAVIADIDGNTLTLEEPLRFDHEAGELVVFVEAAAAAPTAEPTATGAPSLPVAGSGGTGGSSAGLWIAIGLLLAAAGAGLSGAGWRYARSRSLTS